MATTYVLLDKANLTGTQSSVTFSGLGTYSSSYTDFNILMSGRDANTGAWEAIFIEFNSDATSGNYSNKSVYGTGSGAGSQAGNQYCGYLTTNGNTSNTFSNSQCYIPNFSSSNAKSWSWDAVTENNATTAIALLGAGLWSGTSAITSIKLSSSGSGFVSGSSFYLYGIKNS